MTKLAALTGVNGEHIEVNVDLVCRITEEGGITKIVQSDGHEFRVKGTVEAAKAAIFNQPPEKVEAVPPSTAATQGKGRHRDQRHTEAPPSEVES